MSHSWTKPSWLQPGDCVTVIAPSGALKEHQSFEAGLEVWRSQGYRVNLGLNWNSRYGYLAGDDVTRRKALQQAWQDPDCRAILCVRGGYGSARLLENWNWHKVDLSQPKWLIGFSDVTGLLWSLAVHQISSLHAPVLTTLAEEPLWSQQRLFNYLQTGSLAPLKGQGWGGGQAEGILLPANLAVATNLLSTTLQPKLEEIILAIEDVGEAPYRIDRMLTHWRLLGAFRGVKGIAIGSFSNCEGTAYSWTVEQVLRDRLGDLNIPIVSDLPFGHDGANAALPVGITVKLDGDQGILKPVDQKATHC